MKGDGFSLRSGLSKEKFMSKKIECQNEPVDLEVVDDFSVP